MKKRRREAFVNAIFNLLCLVDHYYLHEIALDLSLEVITLIRLGLIILIFFSEFNKVH